MIFIELSEILNHYPHVILVVIVVMFFMYVSIARVLWLIARKYNIRHAWLIFVPIVGSWYIGVTACNVKGWVFSMTPLWSLLTAIFLPYTVYLSWSGIMNDTLAMILSAIPLIICVSYQLHITALSYEYACLGRWESLAMSALGPVGACIVDFKLQKRNRV